MQHVHALSNAELTQHLCSLVTKEQMIKLESVLSLIEVKKRKLYAELGFSSLFTFCVEYLGLTEGATHRRVTAAKVLERFPQIVPVVARREVSITALSKVEKILNDEHVDEILTHIKGKSIREVERLLLAEQGK